MKIQELLDQCMVKLGVETDYKLAKKMEINNALISMYRSGKRVPDAYAIFKIAETLDLDEKMLIAQFEAESEKNPVRKEYWTKKAVSMGAPMMMGIFLIVTSIVTPDAHANDLKGKNVYDLVNNIHYAKLMAEIKAA